jgi:hypothetical protein
MTISQARMKPLSEKQLETLKAFATDGEAPDIADFDGPAGFHNRERVIKSLIRRGLLTDDRTLTNEGMKVTCTCTHEVGGVNQNAHGNDCPMERAR